MTGILFIFVCLCGCLSIGISIMCEPGTHGGPKRVLDNLRLLLLRTVSVMWVLEPDPGSSPATISVLLL